MVVVVVTHDPGPWFDDVLDGLASQDYPNLRVLFLDTGSSADLAARIGPRLPGAFVRPTPGNPGFGAVANDVLGLVEGASFFCICHDDVALDPSAVRLLVEEAFRSNAGVTGPKLVAWDDPIRLLDVGLSIDKFGELAPVVEHGEIDQEQHDAVRDVFCIPSACTLVRADLFDALGGFDAGIDFLGEDLDLCWRAHIAGARVVVVPAARARHVEAARLPIDRPSRAVARHRLRTLLTSYSWPHLLRVIPQLIILNVVEVVIALVRLHPQRVGDLASSWWWNLSRPGDLRAKRRVVQSMRTVPDNEIRRLEVRGSAHLAAFLRGHPGMGREGGRLAELSTASRSFVSSVRSGDRRASVVTWSLVLAAFFFGCRSLLREGIPPIGGMLAFPSSATDLLREYVTGWWQVGLGSAVAIPTGIALMGLGGVALLGGTGLLRDLLILGMIPLGFLGMWRLLRPFASQRGQITGLLAYAAVPVAWNALNLGHWDALVTFGAFPFALGRVARLGGMAPFGGVGGDPGPGISPRRIASQVAALALLLAVVSSIAPWFALLVLMSAIAIAVASLVTGAVVAALRGVGLTALAVVGAIVLHVPWILSASGDGWEFLAPGAVTPAATASRGLDAILRFNTGPLGTGWMGWAFVVAAVLALPVARSIRWAWTGRAWAIALCSFGLAWASDAGALLHLPSVELLLVPAAAGVALAIGCGGAAYELDVRRTQIGATQLGSAIAVAALAVGLVPTLGATVSGRFDLPTAGFDASLAFLPQRAADGPFRVLWLGDPAALPQPGWQLADGLAYGLSRSGMPDFHEAWPGAPTRAVELVASSVELAAQRETSRLGRLLGPMSIRYIVVPQSTGPSYTKAPAHLAPAALLATLASQLDLRQVEVDSSLVVYENTGWLPERALLGPGAAAASQLAGPAALVTADLSGTTAVLPDSDGEHGATGPLPPAGVVAVSEASDSRWRLEVDGRAAPRRPSFGWANAFEVPGAGQARLSYDTPLTRPLAVVVQVLLWLLALRIVLRGITLSEPGRTGRRWRRPPGRDAGEPLLIDLRDAPLPPAPASVAGSVPAEATP